MPTPVSAARQCLTHEAAAGLDEAVGVASRRGHPQTTSLHLVSSLLSLPNSCLRESCSRTRNNAYSARLQFKALEFSLGVSLDRLPSSQATKLDEPPVSNSLMAAIKRSQAHQRRQPENFSFYQQQQQCSSAPPVVKVELQNLIFSILDDPLVSRVFWEAGFRSFDVKIAALRGDNSFDPPYQFGYSSRYKRPYPLFLRNLSNIEFESRGYRFPFVSGDENSRRIGEVMVRPKKRNPLLVGFSAGIALAAFLEILQKKIEGILPIKLSGVSVVCVADELLKFVNGEDESLKLRLEEVERMLEDVTVQGVVVNLGNLKALAGGSVSGDGLRYLEGKLARLLEDRVGKLWLIGAVAAYELCYQILNKLPSLEEEWDLELLPISSPSFSMGGLFTRSSLMESFVPLGGFFSMPYDTKGSLHNASQYISRCHLCTEKCNHEVAALSSRRCASGAEQYPSLPLQNMGMNFAAIKAKGEALSDNTKRAMPEKKLDSLCQHLQHDKTFLRVNTHQSDDQVSCNVGFQVAEDLKESSGNDGSGHTYVPSTKQGKKNATRSLSTDLGQTSTLTELCLSNMQSKTNVLSIPGENPSKFIAQPGVLGSHCLESSSNSTPDDHASLTSVALVATDLHLGVVSSSVSKEQEKPVNESHGIFIQDVSNSLSTHADATRRSMSNCLSQPSPCCFNCNNVHFKEPEMLYRDLLERVGHQEAAISAVIQAITQSRARKAGYNGATCRGVWINFRGPDRLSKKRLALALAEVLYGSTESLICVDLSFQDETTQPDGLLDSQVTNKYNVKMRGTVVDYLANNLGKSPCVIFLENIDKSDPVVRNSLSQAVKTGRLMDLHGREVNISNSMFLTTSRCLVGNESLSSTEEAASYVEEVLLKAKGHLMQIRIGYDLNDDSPCQSHDIMRGCPNLILMNKRKILGGRKMMDQFGSLEGTKKAHKVSNSHLDLNLPAQGIEARNGDILSESSQDNSSSWLEDFDKQVDQVVVFKPLDFDALGEKLFEEMSECLHDIAGCKCALEVESGAMQQFVAAAYIFNMKRVEDWIRRVLRARFMEAMEKLCLTANSIVKLGTYEGGSGEGQIEGGLLPVSILMN